jgi:hypothetical protein
MRLSDIKDERALDALADIIEPLGEILEDKEVTEPFKGGKRIKAISTAIKNHKSAVIQIMAALNGVPVEEYHFNAITVISTVLGILSDPEIGKVFPSQPQNDGVTSSGTATVISMDTEKI